MNRASLHARAREVADAAVVLVLLTRLSLLIAAPVTLWLVATKRPLAEQGPFFILWNVQALTQLMELGVGTLIVQFASHDLGSTSSVSGLEPTTRFSSHLQAIIRDGRQWYGKVGTAIGVIAGVGGAWLISYRTPEIGRHQLLPWLVAVFFTIAYLRLVPALCVLEGSGELLRVQRMRLVQAVAAIAALWLLLVAGGALYGVAAFSIIWYLVAWGWLRIQRSRLPAIVGLTRIGNDATRHVGDFAAIQRRTGVAWLAWWATPQVITPIVLATHGAAAGGRVGMSFAIATAPMTLGIAWLQARYPRYGALLAKGKLVELRRLARSATVQAASVCVAGALAAAIVVWLIGRASPALGARALPAVSILVIGAANLAWLLIQSMGSYLRAWREEPLAETAVLGAVMVSAGALVAARIVQSPDAIVVSYAFLVMFAVLPMVLAQFWRQHRHRHLL